MTARGIHTCCPEAPSTINVTQNIVELDGKSAIFTDETFTGGNVLSRVLTLSLRPYSQASTQVIYNSATLRPVFDYTVVGRTIVFTFDPSSADSIYVRYLVVDGGNVSLDSAALAVGTMTGFGSIGTAPAGWLLMDGAQQVTGSSHPALYNFLTANLHLTVEGATGATYTLKPLSTSYYDGATVLVGTTIIKF
jgi:hypothetical protein